MISFHLIHDDFVPVLEWSYSSDWTTYTKASTIVWPGYILINPIGLAGLSGIELRICVIEAMPFTMTKQLINQNTTSLIGYIPDLIDKLQSKMGFIPNIKLVPANMNFDELVKTVANGVCDLAVGDITVTSTRREIVDFSNSIFDNSLRIIVRQATSNNVDLFSYLKPFSTGLWLAVLGGSVCPAILLCLIERK
jgi:ionotropic glutamate receptor